MAETVGHASLGLELDDAQLQAELRAAQTKVQEAMRRIDGMRGNAEIGADIRELEWKVKEAEARLRKYDRAKAYNAKLGADTSSLDRSMARVHTELDTLEHRRIHLNVEMAGLKNAERDLKKITSAAGRARTEIVELDRHHMRFGRTLGLVGRMLEGTKNRAQGWAETMSGLTLRIGPFTGSLRQFWIAGVALMPMLTSLAGGFSALVGVLATGALGALTVAGAAVTGLGLAAAGSFFALKPMVVELQNAFKASKALNDAQMKYGKGSKQHEAAQKKFNQTLSSLSPAARSGFRELSTLQARFQKATAPGRRSVFGAIGESIKTASALLPQFAARTNGFLGKLSTGFSGWMKGLRSKEGREVLDSIMMRFNASIPALMRGLGNVGAGLGRVFASAARWLKPTTEGFERWSQSFDAMSRSGALDSRIDRLMSHAQSLVKFFASAGRMMGAFFNAGANDGQRFADSMTRGMDRWTAAIKGGSLDGFFKNGVNNSKMLLTSLGNIVGLMLQWSIALEPITAGMLGVVQAITRIVATIAQLPLMGGALSTFGATLATIWAVGKVSAFAGAVSRASGALKTMMGLQAASAGGMVPGGMTKGSPLKAAGKAGMMGSLAGGVAGVATFALIGTALSQSSERAAEQKKFIDDLNGSWKQYGAAVQGLPGQLDAMSQAQNGARDSAKALADARKRVQDLEERGRRNGPAYTQAVRDLAAAEQAHRQQLEQARSARADALKNLELQKDHVKALTDAKTKQSIEALRAIGADKQADALQAARNRALRDQEQATARATLAQINYGRATRQLPAIAQTAARAYQDLSRAAGVGASGAQQIASRFAVPSDAARVGRTAAAAVKAGVRGSAVVKIVADSSSAEEAVDRLRSRVRSLLKRNALKVDAEGNAWQRIAALLGIKLPKKSVKIDAETAAAQAKVAAITSNIMSIPSFKSVQVSIFEKPVPFKPKARGGGANDSGMALVGEGRGPEWRINRRTGASELIDRPQFRMLSNDDYIIPTESAYRGRARSLFGQVARDLGIPGFKKGRPGTHKYGVKSKYGAVDESTLSAANDKAQGAYDKAKHAKKKSKMYKGRDRYKAIWGRTSEDLRRLRGYNREIERLDTLQQTLGTRMDTAETKGDEPAWSSARKQRTTILGQLKAKHEKALSLAKRGGSLAARLDQQLAGVENDLAGLGADKFDMSGAEDGAGGITADQQAQLDQYQEWKRTQATNEATNSIFRQLFNGPGDISLGAFTAGAAAQGSFSPAPTIIINQSNLHPGDPSILRAIGDAAVAGMGYQGGRTASTEVLGY